MKNNITSEDKVFSLKVNKFGNSAFRNDGSVELSRILSKLCERLLRDSIEVGAGGSLVDSNGTTVGTWEVTSE